ncbi:Gldg family protein [Lachnospiraceae bacterium C1.1]|nr:Gldg family protein [Lachnospiraceae bacterium C1.1]
MLAIFKKELRQYFYSVTGCLFIAVNLFVIGIYFMANNLLSMNTSIANVMNNVLFVLLIMIPILTMRILAEEQRQKTDQLLLTSPVSVVKIVVGKYLAVVSIFLVPVIISCLFPLILTPFGKVNYSESYLSIAGYFLFGAACIAVGVFISSITESQVIAAVISFIVLFLTFLMSGIVSILTTSGDNPAKLLNAFDFISRLDNFMSGIFDIKEAVYFITVIVLMLFLTYQSIMKRRYSVSRNTLSLSVYSNAVIVIAIAISVVVNLFVNQIPSVYSEFDLTSNGVFTLTQDSKDFIAALDQDITIYVLGTKEQLENYDYKEVTNTLTQYSELSDHVKVVYKDPTLDPTFAQQFTSENVTIGSLIVVCGEHSKVVSTSDIYETEVDYSTYQQTRTAYDGEGQITSAISYVTSDDLPKLYVITGHNEASISDFTRLKSAIEKQNIEIEELQLIAADSIPEDASAVMILSPETDYSRDDAAKISDYLSNGGNLIISLNYTAEATPNIDSVLAAYGVNHINGIVFETDQSKMVQNPIYLLPNVESTTITNSLLSANLPALVPQASAFTVSNDAVPDTTEMEEALVTSDSSYVKTDVNNAESSAKEAGDVDGPFDIAVYIKDTVSDNEAKIAAFSTDYIFEDEIDMNVGGANVSIATNALNDMIDQTLNATIPSKSYDTSYLTVNSGTAMLISFLLIIFLPIATLAAGIVVWYRRRKR